MTGRTHDLAAFTAIVALTASARPTTIALSTLILSLLANQIGGIIPDIDQPTAPLWRNLPVGGIFGKVFGKLSGGHRFITHSLLGLGLFGCLFHWLVVFLSPLLGHADTGLIWWSFMVGMASHLLMDGLTKEGIPLFLPWGRHFGFPPLKSLRVTTGKWFERLAVFPALLLLCGWLLISKSETFIRLLQHVG